MPGFVSHTIMAQEVYQKLPVKNANLKYMMTYSLGGDLCQYAKCRYASHHQDMDKFIYNMADYIKENKLTNNKIVISVMYAHICHYIMDNTIHPLVHMIDRCCQKNKKNHTLIELYYDAYLTKTILDKRIDRYVISNILPAKRNKEVKKMIDYVYQKTYNAKHISRYYAFNLWLYRKEKYLYLIFGYPLLRKMVHIDNFLTINKSIDLVNAKELITYKDYQKDMCKQDLLGLYKLSIDRALKYIADINQYLNIWHLFVFMLT